MKRHGCIDCNLMEPAPGQWIGGRCPACTKLAEDRAARQAAARANPPKPPAQNETVNRLRGYLKKMEGEYPGCWQQVDQMRAMRGRELPGWPSWCFMPLAGAYAVASGGRDDAPPERLGAIAALAALAAWRVTQGIYQFDPTVAQAVLDTPLTGDIPADVLKKIPEWCVYIETPGLSYFGSPSHGFFALLEYDANDGREELRFTIDMREGEPLSTPIPVHLNHGSLLAGIVAGTREAARQADIFSKQQLGPMAESILAIPPEQAAYELIPRINLLLYLCSTNAEMRERKTGQLRPRRATLTKTKNGMRMFPPDQPGTWDVGFRLGAAIRHAQEVQFRKPGDGTHASPRPHIRKAHWHSFWTGPKAKPSTGATDRSLVLHWLPPLPVNVRADAGVVPTLHEVEAPR